MRTRPARLACTAFVCAALLAGCGYVRDLDQPSKAVAFTTDKLTYDPGEEVVLTLRNVYDQAIGYNLCTSGLQRNVNGEWEPVDEDRVCTMQLNTLEPGEVETYSIELPESLTGGAYRYSTGVEGLRDPNEPPGPDQSLATNPFQVE